MAAPRARAAVIRARHCAPASADPAARALAPLWARLAQNRPDHGAGRIYISPPVSGKTRPARRRPPSRKRRPAPPAAALSRDGEKGFTRRHGAKAFEYFDAHGERVATKRRSIDPLTRDPARVDDVWICGDEPATCRPRTLRAGRKQYRYIRAGGSRDATSSTPRGVAAALPASASRRRRMALSACRVGRCRVWCSCSAHRHRIGTSVTRGERLLRPPDATATLGERARWIPVPRKSGRFHPSGRGP